MSHFRHDRRNLRRETPGRQPLSFGRNRRRVLRLPRRDGRSARHRASRERRPTQAAKRASASPSRGRVARAQHDPTRRAVRRPPRPGSDRRRGGRTIRRVLLEAATSTTRDTWSTCTCPDVGRASGKRSLCTITAPASRLSRRSCARDSAGSERRSSSSQRFRNQSRS